MNPALLRRFGKNIAAFILGAFMSFLVFLALPLLQAISEATDPTEEISLAPALDPPDPPEIEEPEPPEEPDEPEEEIIEDVPLDSQLAPPSLDLDVAGGAGGGYLTQGLSDSLSKTIANALDSSTDVVTPKAVYQAPPEYPDELVRQGISGKVTLVFVVDKSGRVKNIDIDETTDSRFNQAAIDALKKWRFEPGTKGGDPATFKLRQPMLFEAQ